MKLRNIWGNERGQAIQLLIAIMVVCILAVSVVLGIWSDLMDTTTLTGIPLTIIGFIGVIVACYVLYLIATFTSG